MTDPLFDPTPYGPGREVRVKPEPETRTIINGGQWYAVAHLDRPPSEVAHKVKRFNANTFGAAITECGLVGRVLDIEVGAKVRPCRKCEP